MRKTNKLLSAVIAIAMVLSTVALPVIAEETFTYVAPTNIAGTVTGVNTTTGAPTYTGLVKASADATNPYYAKKNTCTLSFEDGVISVSGRSAEATAGIEIRKLGVQSGKKYYLSAEFRRDSDPYIVDNAGNATTTPPTVGNLRARMYFHTEGTEVSGTKAAAPSGQGDGLGAKELTEKGEWYTVSAVQSIGVNESGTKELGLNFGFKVGQNSNSKTFDYSIRNIVVYEISDLECKKTAVNDKTATFTFNNALGTVTKDNFTVSPAADISVEKNQDGNEVAVTLSNYDYSTTYTITTKDIKDAYGQALETNANAEIVTGEEPKLVSAITSITGDATNGYTITAGEMIKASNDASTPYYEKKDACTLSFENGVISVTGRQNKKATAGIEIRNLGVQSGKTYYFSADFRRDSDPYIVDDAGNATTTPPTVGNQRARIYLDNIDGSKAKAPTTTDASVYNEVGTIAAAELLTKGEWITVGKVHTIDTKESGTKELGLILGFKVGQNTNSMTFDFSMRNIQVFEVSALTADAAAGTDDNTAVFTFNNKLGVVATTDFTVNNGASISNVAVNGKTCTVTISGVTNGSKYTVSTNGVKDMYGQTLATEVSKEITGVASGSTDPGTGDDEQVGSTVGQELAGTITGVNTTTGAPTYTGLVKASADATNPYYAKKNTCTLSFEDGVISVSGRSAAATAGIEIKKLGVQSGKTYYLSAEFRRDSDPHIADNPGTVGNLKARMYFHTEGTEVSGTKAAAPSGDLGEKELTEKEEWYTVSTVQTIGVNESGTKELGLHFGFKVGQNTNAESFDFSVRNIQVIEIAPITVTAEAGTENNTAVFTYSEDVEVTPDDFTVIPAAEIDVSGSGKEYTVTLSGVMTDFEYKITANDAVSKAYGHHMDEDDRVSATVIGKANDGLGSNLLANSDDGYGKKLDYSFEGTDEGYATRARVNGYDYEDTRIETYKDFDSEIVTGEAVHGNEYILETNRKAGDAGKRVTRVPVQVGKSYRLSVWTRLYQDSGPVGDDTAKICISGIRNDVVNINLYSNERYTINNSEWTQVIAEISVTKANDSVADDAMGHFHLGLETTYNLNGTWNDILVDYFSVQEIDLTKLAVSSMSIKDGATDVPVNSKLTLNFSNPVDAETFTTDCIKGATVKDVKRVTDNQFTVDFGTLKHETDYTITISGVKNKAQGIEMTPATISFRTAAREELVSVVNGGEIISFEDGTISPFSVASTCDDDPDHWIADGTGKYSGEYSMYNYGCGCLGQVNLLVPTEPGEEYIMTFWAKFNGTVVVRPRADLDSGGAPVEDPNPPIGNTNRGPNIVSDITLKGDGTWQRYLVPITASYTYGDGRVIGLTQIKMKLNPPAQPTWIDDVAVYKNPGANSLIGLNVEAKNVDVKTETIELLFSNVIHDDIVADIEGGNYKNYITFTSDDDVEIEAVEVAEDGATIVLTLSDTLAPSTEYTVAVTGIQDEIGQLAEDSEASFTTESAYRVDRALAIDGGTATAKVVSRSRDILSGPVIMHVAADGTVNTTSLAWADFELDDEADLSLSATDGTAYLMKGVDNIALLSQPVSTDAIETGTALSTDATAEIVTNTATGTVTVSGTAEANSTVVIMALASDSASNAANITSYKAGNRDITVSALLNGNALSDSNIGTYAKKLAYAVANENGEYTIDFTLPTDSTAVYGVLVSGDSLELTSKAKAVYMATSTEVTTALNEINGATSSGAMETAIDTYASDLGLDTTTDIYESESVAIARAIYKERDTDGYTYDELVELYADVSEYYETQHEAIAAINDIEQATTEGLTDVLAEYADVFGNYEDNTKLNYQAKYAAYGETNVNNAIIASAPYATMADFIAKVNSLGTTDDDDDVPQGGDRNNGRDNNSSFNTSTSLTTPGISANTSQTEEMFSDIAGVEWAKDSIENLATQGIINGYEDGTFRPNNCVTREEFVKLMVVSFNIPTVSSSALDDVDVNAWYAPYVAAAVNAGFVKGVSDNEFGTGNYITRQDLVTMIYRITQSLETPIDQTTDVFFDDEDRIGDWAKEAVVALAGGEIINGVSEGIFAPTDNATRAQVAVILDRLFQKYIDVYFN